MDALAAWQSALLSKLRRSSRVRVRATISVPTLLSMDDSTGGATHPRFDIDTAVQRLRAARLTLDAAGGDTLPVSRAECCLVSRPDVTEMLARLQVRANAGADSLYAPGIRRPQHRVAVVAAVAPKPVNLLPGSAAGLTLQDAAALGVRRVSVGGALARVAWELRTAVFVCHCRAGCQCGGGLCRDGRAHHRDTAR